MSVIFDKNSNKRGWKQSGRFSNYLGQEKLFFSSPENRWESIRQQRGIDDVRKSWEQTIERSVEERVIAVGRQMKKKRVLVSRQLLGETNEI